MDDLKKREELVRIAERMDRRNYQTNNGGNLSARCGHNKMLIKATDVSFSEVITENLTYSDFDGQGLTPGHVPSKEAILHGKIYQDFDDVNVILHCHSPWATAWSEKMMPLELTTYHAQLKLSGCVPVFDTRSYAVSSEDAVEVIKMMKSKYPESRAFLLRRHGVMVLGKDFKDAANLMELVEETAIISILAQLLNSAQV